MMLTPGVDFIKVQSTRGAFGVMDPVTNQMLLTRTPPPDRLDTALQKVSQTFDLWRKGRLGNCDAGGIAVTNVVPRLCLAAPKVESEEEDAESGGLTNKAPFVSGGGSRSGAGRGGGSGAPRTTAASPATTTGASRDWMAAVAAGSASRPSIFPSK
jgi:hypothetical protein